MVTKYGMSDTVGSIMFGSGQEEVFLGRDFAQSKNYSEQTAAVIDVETKKIIDKAYNNFQKNHIYYSIIPITYFLKNHKHHQN